ncbi:uncharacterized protein LOC133302277 [Gastrolobium bilobum]|uniref:uncharacterized protein LOC133302277 n=1 Tax=Gastrolobium bilobum TaxID=150636 RepID=UPI002AB161AA|nr:uncharacterized protein LOC133302277 [Gastrolobium bilobum]
MIKTLNPYPNSVKTAEIMSRYRPIAPKPESSSDSSLSLKIKQSPYLRNLWPQLQERPTRTRKRGRASIALPSSLKRQKTHVLGFCSPCHITSPAKNLSLHSFAPPSPLPQQLPLPNHGLGVLNCSSLENTTATNPSLVTLPLLPCSPSATILSEQGPAPKFDLTMPRKEEVIDFNTKVEIPQEKDLLQQLQKPATNNVIAPQPVRPICSCIMVGCINENSTLPSMSHAPKKPEELEEEVESEALPAVISDSKNRVRMANSAYKEMVGQPECPWLESMVNCGGDGRLQCLSSCKRISGEITLHLCDSSIPLSSNGFSCWVTIEWQTQHKKCSVNAFCDVIKLSCESRDYHFTWRFHTRTREASQSSCNT